MQGVSLFSKDRGRHHDVFELALTAEGIEIRRPGESARHLSWARITEWEIEQRRGGVLLTLRGGGSVTPLVIPRWNVDELDLILREVTSQLVEPLPEPPSVVSAPVVSAPAPAPPIVRPPVVPVPAPAPAPVPAPVVPQAPLPPPNPKPTWEELSRPVTQMRRNALLDPTVTTASGPIENEEEDEEEVAGALVWPEDEPLKEFGDLAWPSSMDKGELNDSVDIEFVMEPERQLLPPIFASEVGEVGPEHLELPEWSVREPMESSLEISREQPPVVSSHPVVPASRPLNLPPVEGASELPAFTLPTPLPAATPRIPRAARRRRNRRKFPARAAVAVVLLAAFATAVVLVLFQSAGIIHLGFLGTPV